ncbi:MAG: hypothetical protein K9G64_01975 [Bacteroidia bacterium]|nr:hypothetical protein [Bacteroidia bacterium]
MINTPILFLIKSFFNENQVVYNTVLHNRPNKIYIATIIVRNNSNDLLISNYVKSLVQQITWKCDIKIKPTCDEANIYKLHNETLDWFFKKEEMGIIINSDCLPNECFYSFCDKLLNYYKDDNRIMYINSLNGNESTSNGDGSYCFSKYNQTGAWATWKRTWSTIQPNLNNLSSALKLKTFDNILTNEEYNYWIKQFQIDFPEVIKYYNHKTLLSQWFNNGLAITPNHNLSVQIAENNGNEEELKLFSQKTIVGILDIKHPAYITVNKIYDEKLFKYHYKKGSVSNVIKTLKTKTNYLIKNYINI